MSLLTAVVVFNVYISVMCLILQPPHFASSASMFQAEMGSLAPAIASHPGVTRKVSDWLQQTHDIDGTTNGKNNPQS